MTSRLYQSLAAATLALGLSGCDVIREIILSTEWGKEEVERGKIKREYDKFGERGYKTCQKLILHGRQKDCFNLRELRRFDEAKVTPEEANPLIFMDRRAIVDLKRRKCDLSEFPAIYEKLQEEEKKGNIAGRDIAQAYAKLVCLGETTIEKILEYDQRFRTPKNDYHGSSALELIEDDVSSDFANRFPENYAPDDIVTFKEREKDDKTARLYLGLQKKNNLSAEEVADLDDHNIKPKLAQWYFDLEKIFPSVSIEVKDIVAFETAIARGEITKDKVRLLARKVQNEEPLLHLLRERKRVQQIPQDF